MKKIFAFVTITAVLSACTKNYYVTPIPLTPTTSYTRLTLSKDSTQSDVQVTTLPTTVINSAVIYTNAATGALLSNGKFFFDSAGGFSPTRDIKNLKYSIKDVLNTTYFSIVSIPAITGGVNTFVTVNKQLPEKVYKIEFQYDVLSSAMGNGKLNVEFYYESKQRARDTMRFTALQNVNFTGATQASTLTTALNLNNPPSGIMVEGLERNALSVSLTSQNGISSNLEFTFKILGSAASTVTQIKLIESGGPFIGQASVVNGIVTIPTTYAIALNTTKVFSAIPIIGSGAVTSDVSGGTISIVLDKITYNSNKVIEDDRVGNSFLVYKSLLMINKSIVSTNVIINNASIELYKYTISTISNPIALKQYTYEVVLNDQGFNDDLVLRNFQILENGVDVTSQYRITDANGVIDTVFSENDTKLYLTRTSGVGETVVSGGTVKTFSFRATPTGFTHPNDGDGFSVRLLGDNTQQPVGYKYVNSGSNSNSYARLFNSISGNSSAQVSNFIWSDVSASSHSGQIGLSSNDWTNGYLIAFSSLTANIFYQ